MSQLLSDVIDAEIVDDASEVVLSVFAEMVAEFGDPFAIETAEDWQQLKEYAHGEPWWPRDAVSVMRHVAAQAGTTATQWTAANALELRASLDGEPPEGAVADPRVLALMDTWKARLGGGADEDGTATEMRR